MKRLLLIVLLALIARAHDFWIEPSNFHPRDGEQVYASLRVGENFEGDAVPRMSQRIESFVVRDAKGEKAIGGVDGIDPAGVMTAGNAPAVIAYRSNFAEVELPRAKFDEYLKLEGLDNRIRPTTNGTQRERYARFVKSMIGGRATNASKPFGWRFELVPVSATQFRAVYEQKPLAGTLVIALSQDGKRVSARSDAKGMVTLQLPSGVWLVKSVHMVAAPRDSGFAWESYWASITFAN